MSQLFTAPIYRATDSNGNPMSGAKLYFYATGTTTLQSVYTDDELTTPHSSPVVSDSAGLFDAIYLDPALTYRVILKTSADATVKDFDPVSASTNAEALYFNEGGTGAVTMSVADALRSGPLFADQYGVLSTETAANNVTAIRHLVDRAEATGRLIMFREDGIYLNENIQIPVSSTAGRVSLAGMGWDTGVIFTGAAVDKGFWFNETVTIAPAYSYCGSIQNMRIRGQNGAKQAVKFENVNHPLMWRCLVEGFDGCAVQFYDALVGVFGLNLLVGNGSASRCAVEVGGTDYVDFGSTNFQWLASRINGGLAAGASGKLGGLSVDRCAGVYISGGNIESTGQPLSIACGAPTTSFGRIASTQKPVSNVTITGEIGFERPGNNNVFIDIGSGWNGTAGQAVQGINIISCHGLPSGTTTITHGIRVEDTTGFVAYDGCYLGCLNATSDYEFVGTANSSPRVKGNRRLASNAWPWVRENSTQRLDAHPYTDWSSLEIRSLNANTTAASATPSIQIHPNQGGIYGNLILGGAADITNITLAGGAAAPRNTRLTVFGDGVRALVHGAGGNGQIYMRSGANFTPTVTQAITFVADATSWREC